MPDARTKLGSTRERAGTVAVLLVAVFAGRVLADSPTLGLSLLYIVPTLLASIWFGPRWSVVVGVLCGALHVVDAGVLNDDPYPLLGGVLRAAVFSGVGAGFGILFERQVQLHTRVAEQDRQIGELRHIRDALVPPDLPEVSGVELATSYAPAQESVGGDFYLVAPGPERSTIIVVGDVTGKGIKAARRASFARAALATFASFTDDPARLLEMANYSLIERSGTAEDFVTAACVTLRPEEGTIAWALAGHPPPVYLDDGQTLDGARPGLPLGVELDLDTETNESTIAPRAGLVIFTDGLLEARSPAVSTNGGGGGEQFGSPRVAELLQRLRGAAPREVVDELRGAAEGFAGGALQDDLCLVAARLSPSGG